MPQTVSIVVPVYNGLPHLRDLVASLIGQSYQDLEIVFSEGGGSDDSLAYLRSLDDPRIRIITQPAGTSAGQNWTRASEAATGSFTKLICQDDLLHPQAIAWQVEDLDAHPEAAMAVARRDIVDAAGKAVFRSRGLPGIPAGLVDGSDLLRQCYLRGTNVIGEPLAVLFRTQALHQALPWADDNPLMLDLAMYAKVAAGQSVVVRHASVGAFRVSGTSWSTRLARQQAEQTRRWQQGFEPQLAGRTAADRTRAALGRHLQVSLRRAAYAALRVSGRLRPRP